MSLLNCDCPVGTYIPTITPSTCPTNIGQIQKAIFWRRGNSVTITNAKLAATWAALLAAVNSTKAQVTPFIEKAIITAGEPITEGGGDNNTLNGVTLITGANPSQFSGMFMEEDQAVIAVLKQYMCESLEVIFINEYGQLVGASTDNTNLIGFDVEALFIGDLKNEGYGKRDSNAISFMLKKNWSDHLELVTPTDFDALELANA